MLHGHGSSCGAKCGAVGVCPVRGWCMIRGFEPPRRGQPFLNNLCAFAPWAISSRSFRVQVRYPRL